VIKYRFAKDINNNTIDVYNVSKNNNIKYYCIGCGKELIAKLGNKNEHHFSHKQNENCNNETYLHELSKKVLFEHLLLYKNANKQFFITLNKEKCLYSDDLYCELLKTQETHDLLKYYKNIYLEKYVGEYKPDILLTNNNDNNLFIEIAVTHESTDKKKQNNKIIEIFIENETDIYEIINDGINESNKNVKLYNFRKNIIKSINCNENNCNILIGTFILTASGEIKLRNIKIASLPLLQNDKNIQSFCLKNNTNDISENCYNFVIECKKRNLLVKNCYICKYSSVRIFNKTGKNIYAIKCVKNEKDLLLGLKGVKCKYYITKE
jgi:hypothetical protein